MERHPERSRTAILADLNGACIQPGTNDLWVVGSGGLIAVSKDEGRTWTRRPIIFETAKPVAPNALNAESNLAGPKAAKPIEVVVSGHAQPGDRVTLYLNGARSVETTANQSGNWTIRINDMPIADWLYGKTEDPGGKVAPAFFKVNTRTRSLYQIDADEFDASRGAKTKPKAGLDAPAHFPLQTAARNGPTLAWLALVPLSPPPAEPPRRDPKQQSSSGVRPPGPGEAPVVDPPPVSPQVHATYELFSISFLDQLHGVSVGDNGSVIATTDGGATWRSVECELARRLLSVVKWPDRLGAIGERGAVLELEFNESNVLTKIDADEPTTLHASVVFKYKDDDNVLAAGDHGVFFESDGTIVPGDPADPTLYGLDVAAPSAAKYVAIAAGEHGTVAIRTEVEDGTNPSFRKLDSQSLGDITLRAVTVFDSGRACVVGERGASFYSTDWGKTWTRSRYSTTYDLRSLAKGVGAPSTLFAVGYRGTVLKSSDSGASWTRTTADWAAIDATLVSSIRYPSPPTGILSPQQLESILVAVGKVDLSTSSLAARVATRWPAPWYYLALIVVGLLLVPAALAPRAKPDESKVPASIADRLASDKPLEPGQPDPLKFNALALGLSRFLRNENTQPPLTLAVTGRWGQGKSSLMNLVKADLHRFGVRSVWFNAWHHQTEEVLLAALLSSIKSQAIPSIWRPEGIEFRLKLLWIRTKRRAPAAVIVAVLFALSAGYAFKHKEAFSDSVAKVASTAWGLGGKVLESLDLARPSEPPGKDASALKPPSPDPTAAAASATPATTVPAAPPLPVFVVAALAALRALYLGLKSFGADPSKLMASLAQNAKVHDLREQTSFRERFSREFEEVTRALHPRDMLIIIDDLDRCQPANVLEALEAVNFLVSSGECFVMLGMDSRIVEHFVSLGFAKVAATLPTPAEAAQKIEPDHSRESKQRRRREFAREYMEKLVQIQVPVPLTTPEIAARLADERPPAQAEPRGRWRRACDAVLAFGLRAALPLMILLALVLAVVIGALVPVGGAPPSANNIALQQPTAAPPTSPTRITGTAPTPSVQTDPTAIPQPCAVVLAPAMSPWAQWSLYALLTLPLLAVGGVLLLNRPEIAVKDSQAFKDALDLWMPFVYEYGVNTPRSVKRFTNRVRFLAMLGRPQSPYISRWSRFKGVLLRIIDPLIGPRSELKPDAESPALADMTEPMLIAWAALERALGRQSLNDPSTLVTLLRAARLGSLRPMLDNPTFMNSLLNSRAEYCKLVAGLDTQ
jgi:photosystem II stability/assembly factor-like uncharacterized protein